MSRSAFFIMLFAFAAGGVLGYVAGTSTGEPTLPDVRDPEPEQRGGPAEPRVVVIDSGAGNGAQQTVAELAADVTIPDGIRGTGIIAGSALLEDGTPLSGVVVRATPYRRYRGNRMRGGSAPDTNIDGLVQDYVERLVEEEYGRAETKTDSEGSYELHGIGAGDYRLQAWLDGYHLQGSSWKSRAGQRMNFIAKPVVRLPISVTMPDGSVPALGATIIVRMGPRQDGQRWTPETGAIALEPGRWTVQANCGDQNEFRSEEVEILIEAGVQPDPVDLHLSSRPGIKGRVVFPPELGITGHCQVKLLRVLKGKAPDPERLRREGVYTYVNPIQNGVFAFHDLAPGTYLIGIIGTDQKVAVSDTVEVGSEMVEKDLIYPEPDPGSILLVKVEGPDGSPVTDASFTTAYERDSRRIHGGGSASMSKLPDGRYRVAHCTVDPKVETPEGRHVLTVTSSRFGTKRLTYVRADTRELTVRFDEPAMLTVTVLGYAGSEYEGRIRLAVGQSRGPRYPPGYSMPYQYIPGGASRGLSPEGIQKFGPLSPGERTLSLTITNGNRHTTAATEKLVLRSGANTATIGIPALHTLTVLCGDTRNGAMVTLSTLAGTTGARYSRQGKVKDGQVVFEGVPSGRYQLYASGAVSGRMETSVQGSSTVRFVPVAVDALRVSITDPQGAYARAGLREGDLIVGVDGTEFTDSSQMYALMTLARKKESTIFSVLRGGGVVKVEIDLRGIGLYGGKGAGGTLRTSAR